MGADGVFDPTIQPPPSATTRRCTSCYCQREPSEFGRWPGSGKRYTTCTPCRAQRRAKRGQAHRPRATWPGWEQPLPLTSGLWTLVSDTPVHVVDREQRTKYVVRVRCQCGYQNQIDACKWRRGTASQGCRSCIGRRLIRERYAVGSGPGNTRPAAAPRAARDPKLVYRETSSYADDLDAQQFVAQHPDGGTLEEVGEYFGLTRERIRQIEAMGLRKLRTIDHRSGNPLAAALEHILSRRREHAGLRGSSLSWDELPGWDMGSSS